MLLKPRRRTTQGGPLKLEVSGLRKTYGSHVALEAADIAVHEGEFLTLLGPSGSGKSTLLLAIAGLTDPGAGEVRMDGRRITHLPPFLRGIGMVFQNYALFPHMSVYDNVAFPLRMRRVPEGEIETSVREILDVIRLPAIAGRFPSQLSGGQQQRVALARALVFKPSLVLMDEPLGALDKKLRSELQLEIKRLHDELELAILYVTHDQEEALVMSDRICLMRNGRIEQLGSPEELYFRPRSVFAADFLGESNLLPGVVTSCEAGRAAVRLEDGSRLDGLPEGEITAGDSVRVMIRPEAIAVIGAESVADNQVHARLEEAVLLGGTTKCFFRTEGGLRLCAQVLTDGPVCGARESKELRRLGWSLERTVVLRDA